MSARVVWRHRVDGLFQGSWLDGVGRQVVFEYHKGNDNRLCSLDLAEGRVMWDDGWTGIDDFWLFEGRLYLGGECARCVALDGSLVAERRFIGDNVSVLRPAATGPVFAAAGMILGLHFEDLGTTWEQPDPDEAWTAHGSYLCRMTEAGWLESLELPSLRQVAFVRPNANLGISALHAHHGDTWCHFGATEGGRTAIDLKSGEVAWASSDPAGYGLVVFEGAFAYSNFHGLSAYDLASGNRIWVNELSTVSSRPHVEEGQVYVASTEGFVQVMDALTGRVLAVHRFEYKPSGLGFEPSPVVPFGDNRIVVGTRREIICLETS